MDDFRYANCIIKVYPNYVDVSCFNRAVVDDSILHKSKRGQSVILDELSGSDLDDRKLYLKDLSSLRAKHKIFDIALLNDFEYFVTFTFNDQIVNGYDFDECIKKVKTWTNNQVKRNGLRYLLVPELHPTSGRIHLHGLLVWDNTPVLYKTSHKDRDGRVIYNLPAWKYGFSTIVSLDFNKEAVSKYVTKYVTKELEKICGNYYYAGGKGLLREPDTYYANIPYDDFNGQEYDIDRYNIGAATMKVKYNIMPHQTGLEYLGFVLDNNLNV